VPFGYLKNLVDKFLEVVGPAAAAQTSEAAQPEAEAAQPEAAKN